MIVSFHSSHLRDAILKNRRLFSYRNNLCNIFVTEDLTTENSKLRIALLKHSDVIGNVSLKGSFIYASLSDGFEIRFLPTDNIKEKLAAHFGHD